MISEQNYNEISEEVYKVDPLKVPSISEQVSSGYKFKSNGQEFEVLGAEGNSLNPTENGMQAMAVAPIKGYDAENKPIADTSQIVIAYAGMNGNERFRTKPFLV